MIEAVILLEVIALSLLIGLALAVLAIYKLLTSDIDSQERIINDSPPLSRIVVTVHQQDYEES